MAKALWPGEDGTVAANRLRVTLTRLRSLLGQSLEADRESLRLTQVDVWCDLWEEERMLREALDEVEPQEQILKLAAHGPSLSSNSWREIQGLALDGTFTEWDEICRSAIRRLMELAVQERDWSTADVTWQWMRDRGDLLIPVCERFLDSHSARGTLDEGIKMVRRAALEAQLDVGSEPLRSVFHYAQQLESRSVEEGEFNSGHFQSLGSALLGHTDKTSLALAKLLVIPEVQLDLQASPALYIKILEGVSCHLVTGEEDWVAVQAIKVATYASLYENDQVIETCRSVLAYKMPPERATTTTMHLSFALFQLRQWDEAFSTIYEAQQLALQAELERLFDVCRITEGAYLWHLGRVDEARQIYDQYLEKYAGSEDTTSAFNAATCQGNYAVIELVFGDLQQAKYYAELAYDQRRKVNLSRHMPLLLALLGVITARTGDLFKAIDYAIESLKLTYQRGSSREGQINMEWICGVLVVANQREEAWQIMRWVNEWRKQTRHERSVCETQFAESLDLQDLEGSTPVFSESSPLRGVVRFQLKCLRAAQRSTPRRER